MSRLSQNLSANILANAWSTALSLLLTPLYVSLLGVESYGLVGFSISWSTILGVLDTGISATAVRETAWLSARPDGIRKIPSLLRSLEVVYWCIILVLGAGLLFGAWWFGAGWFASANIPSESVRAALMLMVVSLVVQVPSGLYVGGLMGLQRQVECSALVALFGTIRGLGGIAVLLVVRPDIRVFFLWQIVISAFQTSVMRWSLMRRVPSDGHPAQFSARMLRSLRRFAGEAGLVTALSVLLTQADKIILSRLASLEMFGLYMLAWTVASGLSRMATPLLQAFSPRFTELVSSGDNEGLARQVRIACQLTNALILPPAALLVLLAYPILLAWTGNQFLSAGAAPLLAIMAVGILLSACSYPALSVLYSRRRLRPVIAVNLAAVIVLLPVLTVAVINFGAVGAAFCWGVYGLLIYVAYQRLGLQDLPATRALPAIMRDFVVPGLVSFAVAGITWHWCRQLDGRIEMVALLSIGLIAGWGAALVVCRDLYKIAVNSFRWNSIATPWSA